MKLIRQFLGDLKKEDGWTFIETMIVIAIVIMLTGGVALSLLKNVDKARAATAKSDISSYRTALDNYYLDCGSVPTEEQGLSALWEKPQLAPVPENWDGPYVVGEIKPDPWERDYIYSSPGNNGLPYTIESLGADGAEGGEGVNADISS